MTYARTVMTDERLLLVERRWAEGATLTAIARETGINFNTLTSAMSQMQFQNIRNLGANGNQPLITNQNDFQFFDNVTWLKGKHTLKAGGSLTLRSREILNADSITGIFRFDNNNTSACTGQTTGCSLPKGDTTGFDVASFLLGIGAAKSRTLFDAGTYTEKRPVETSKFDCLLSCSTQGTYRSHRSPAFNVRRLVRRMSSWK